MFYFAAVLICCVYCEITSNGKLKKITITHRTQGLRGLARKPTFMGGKHQERFQ